MTHQELFSQAVRLAGIDGKEWQDLTMAERAGYGETARRIAASRRDGSITFPMWVKTSYCTTQTHSGSIAGTHGRERMEITMPVHNFYVGIARNTGKVFASNTMAFAAPPCGPECVNR